MTTTISLTKRPGAGRVNSSPLHARLAKLPGLVPLPLPEVAFVFVGPSDMAEINWRFLRHEGPTDVITFHHGEILVCPAVASAHAREYGVPYAQEILRYCVHGWLHLAGHTDKKASCRRIMFDKQEKIIVALLKNKHGNLEK